MLKRTEEPIEVVEYFGYKSVERRPKATKAQKSVRLSLVNN